MNRYTYRERHAGQGNGYRKHHHGDTDELRHGGDELRHALVERLSERVDVVGDAAEHVTHRVGLKVSKRHAVDLLNDLTTHAVAHTLCNAVMSQP